MNRRIVALLAGMAAFALVSASAATLGGLQVGGVGAEAADIQACTAAGIDVEVTTTYDAPTGSFLVGTVDLTVGDAGCNGEVVDVVLYADGGTTNPALGAPLSATVADGTAQLVPTTDIAAQEVDGIAVSIVGTVAG